MTGERSPETRVFLFTDLESSTRLWQRFPDAMKTAIERHDAILRDAVERDGGIVVKTTGDGLMAVFSSVADGAAACVEAQKRLQGEEWGEVGDLRVRMGMHVGEAHERAGDYVGPPVNRAARIMAAAHGGQILLSSLAAQLADGHLSPDAELRDLGEHRLRDLFQPEHIFQLLSPGLLRDFPPLATLSLRPNNLPTQASEFLGRRAQLSALRQLLDAPGVRLVTLVGPGGIGKTRLALQAAADQIDRFEGGVFFVDLSTARNPDAAFEAIARAVGVSGTRDERPLEVLKQLQSLHMLLLLDNFEQVIDAADGVAELLLHCPKLKVLVTSREALNVRGEHLFPIPPLLLPDVSTRVSAETAAGYEAVRLFVERAREARPGFMLTEQNVAAVVEICARLDGLPLAIELAASRLKLFSPNDLRDRLRTRLDVLGSGPRDLPARQRTLRNTIEWSYELLDSEEQTLFRLLSVFAPTRIEAVEAVITQIESVRDVDVVDRLLSLIDKSLVRSVETGGRQRLSMLATILEYATDRLREEPDLDAAATRAHAAYFAEFARSRRESLVGPERESTLDDLASEGENLAKAWRYWVHAGDLEQLNRLLDGLWVLYTARGWYHAAVELTNDLIGVLSAVPATADRTREEITLRTSLARGLSAIQGYTDEVEAAYSQALALAEDFGELPQQFSVLRDIAFFQLYRGEMDKMTASGRHLLALAEKQDDTSYQVDGHLLLGMGRAFSNEAEAGLDHLDKAIALFDPQRGSGRPQFGASPGVVSYTSSALMLWLMGSPDRALERATKALELAAHLNQPFTLAYALFHVGFFDLLRRELSLAHERASAVLEVAQEHDYRIWKALALVLQGTTMTSLGQSEEGFSRVEQGAELYRAARTPPVFWPLFLYMRARGYVSHDRPAQGIDLIDQAIAIEGDGPIYPEYALLKGDLLLAVSDTGAAETWFQSAYEVARRQGVRMAQLRAATRLTRLRRAAGNVPDGGETLRDVYESFTEGFDTLDLTEARGLLET
jgi:predicted ATPase/class 3 adenylate cyclase